MQRFENMRLLAGMRKTLELQMLKTDEETGERQLDKTNAEMAMKMIKLQSDEMRLLTEGANANKAPGRARAPARDAEHEDKDVTGGYWVRKERKRWEVCVWRCLTFPVLISQMNAVPLDCRCSLDSGNAPQE